MGACQRWTSLPFKRPEASVPSQVPWAWGCPWSRSFLDTVSVGFFVAHGAVSLRVISGLQNLRGWQAGKPGERRVAGAERCPISLLLIQRDRLGQGTSLLGVTTYSALFSGTFRHWEEIICSGNSCFIVLLYGSHRAGPQPPVNTNEGWSCSFGTRLHVDLQRTVFPSEPSKHDPLLSLAIPPSPHWWASKLLKFPSPDALQRWPGLCLALLWIAQGHRWGEEGGRQSIYQDVLLYFFYPSPRRWFYFSENPLNSDQVRWLLSLETQELSGHNRYKCRTPKWGALGQWWSPGDFLVILVLKFSSDHFILSIFFSSSVCKW